MKEEDLIKLGEMKGRGEATKAIIAYFKVMGYTEEEIVLAMEQANPITTFEPSEPMKVVKLKETKRSRIHLVLAFVLVLMFIGLVLYLTAELVPDISIEPNKTHWKISAVVQSCSSSNLFLKVTNADITGMPVTLFTIRENNATCSPPTDLQSTGIGEILSCSGNFEDGKVYTIISNNTIDDGIVCNYQ